MLNVPHTEIRSAIHALMLERGLCEAHAQDVAETLVETSLLGIDTHGVRLLPTYLLELEHGRANPRPHFRLTGDFPAAATFHADNALGVVAANEAMREAISRAAVCGIAAIAVAQSNHFGAAGHYARLAARQNKIGLVFSNSDALVAPADGTRAINGTNPIAVAAPGLADDGFFLDMATSQIAYSKVMQALAPGAQAPKALPPLGGYKGQGLGTLVQILCAILTAMPFDADLSHLYAAPYDTPRRIGHFVVAIELRAFVDPNEFRNRLSSLLSNFRMSPAGADQPVMVAGDREAAIRVQRLRDGIPLRENEVGALRPFLERTTTSSPSSTNYS